MTDAIQIAGGKSNTMFIEIFHKMLSGSASKGEINFAARYSKMWLSGKSVYLKHLNSALDKIEKALYNS